MDVLSASPESIARRQRAALEDAERLFIKSRLTGDFPAAPLSRKERDAASPSTLAAELANEQSGRSNVCPLLG